MRIIRISVILMLVAQVITAQTPEWNTGDRETAIRAKIDEKKFDEGMMQDAIMIALSNELKKQKLNEFTASDVLSKAATDYAKYIASVDDAKPGLGGKKEALASRLQVHGGAFNNCTELCFKTMVKKGKDNQSFKEIADEIVFKWISSKATADMIKDPKYLIAGIGCKLDGDGKKVFVSLILGNYNTINDGVGLIKSSGIPITTTNQGLALYDAKLCKNCDKFRNIDSLQRCLVVEGKSVFIDLDMKLFKKIMKMPNDAFAVDIVSQKQYLCDKPNIIDKSLPSRGVMLKPVLQSKMIASNLYEGKEAKSRIKVLLGTMPEGMSNFELNLIVIQNNVFCRNIRPTFTEKFPVASSSKPKILGDTITFFENMDYKPQPDTTYIAFNIPFAFGKSDYRPADIKPMIEALNEPDFVIQTLKITAYSSIEGSEETNEELRMARAQSITKALRQLQKGGAMKSEIFTRDAWSMFFNDIKATKWESLKDKSKEEIREAISSAKDDEQLAHILSRQRFARIEMGVVYDLNSVKKEQDYMIKKFHKSLETGDIVSALNFQKHIMKNINRGRYSRYIISTMNIPRDSVRFAGMQMNKLWIDYYANGRSLDTSFYKEVCRLSVLDPRNEYVAFNKLYYEIKKFDIVDEASIALTQQKIEALRTSKLRKSDVDPINIEYQIKILEAIGNTLKVVDEQKATNDVLARIKSIIDVNTGDWKTALNLAILFYHMNDYDYPIQLLEPFVMDTDADEKLLFTYLSACTHTDYKHLTRPFEVALVKALAKNKERTCELFESGEMSFQLNENPNVKKHICEKCNE